MTLIITRICCVRIFMLYVKSVLIILYLRKILLLKEIVHNVHKKLISKHIDRLHHIFSFANILGEWNKFLKSNNYDMSLNNFNHNRCWKWWENKIYNLKNGLKKSVKNSDKFKSIKNGQTLKIMISYSNCQVLHKLKILNLK